RSHPDPEGRGAVSERPSVELAFEAGSGLRGAEGEPRSALSGSLRRLLPDRRVGGGPSAVPAFPPVPFPPFSFLAAATATAPFRRSRFDVERERTLAPFVRAVTGVGGLELSGAGHRGRVIDGAFRDAFALRQGGAFAAFVEAARRARGEADELGRGDEFPG